MATLASKASPKAATQIIVPPWALATVGTFLLVSCTSTSNEVPPPAEKTTQDITIEALGVRFSLPLNWHGSQEGGAHVFSGPKDSDAFFTTITVQVAEGQGEDLASILSNAFASAEGASNIQFEQREPHTHGAFEGMRYTLTFDLHEQQRKKTGLLLSRSGHLLDVSYASTAQLFAAQEAIFDTLLASLDIAATPTAPIVEQPAITP